jgi:hypothetical protein
MEVDGQWECRSRAAQPGEAQPLLLNSHLTDNDGCITM